MTLDELIIETAINVGEDIEKTDGAYAGDSLVIVNKIIKGLNKAKDLMAEREGYYKTESVTLTDGAFDKTTLTNTVNSIINIEYEEEPLIYKELGDTVEVLGADDETVSVTYFYELADMVIGTLTGVCPVEHALELTYYAAFKYFVQDGGESSTRKAQNWSALWQDALRQVKPAKLPPQKVINVYGVM